MHRKRTDARENRVCDSNGLSLQLHYHHSFYPHTATSIEWTKSTMRTTEIEADAAKEMLEKVKQKLEKDYHHCKEIRNVAKPDELKNPTWKK